MCVHTTYRCPTCSREETIVKRPPHFCSCGERMSSVAGSYVETNYAEYAKIVRILLPRFGSLEALADAIHRDVSWVENLLKEYPEVVGA